MRVYSAGPNTSPSRQFARTVNFLAFNHAPGTEFVVHDTIDREGRYGDHESFSNAGYPAVRLIESLEDKVNGDPNDEVDQIEPAYLAQNTKAVLAVVTAMADGPRPPANISPLRDKGNGVRTLVWEPVPDAASYVVALRSPGSLIYDQQFEIQSNSVEWDGFTSDRFVGLTIAAKDENGLLGPPAPEQPIP